MKVSYYIHFADHLLKAKGEEVFRRVVQEGVDAYINNWKRKEAAEEKAYELKKQAEKLEALRERMKQHKDILQGWLSVFFLLCHWGSERA